MSTGIIRTSQPSDEIDEIVFDIPLHEYSDRNKCHISSTPSLRRVIQVLAFYAMRLDKSYRAPSGPVRSGSARFILRVSTARADPDALWKLLQAIFEELPVAHGSRVVFPHRLEEHVLMIDRYLG
ncbi:uncharacterized protein KD926_009420 [Aspergillus affinis]|uniref:uncharacterized protein n=1 Tax=Aspergillus affinis TaxID=1070780 RepID=UPI0022FEA194|nr:uncharacterized protein KD926_009420 [Aspergillus affinis]KAI9039406.1 hypothetical protein KD926_009420 [Aspergillus affinis]